LRRGAVAAPVVSDDSLEDVYRLRPRHLAAAQAGTAALLAVLRLRVLRVCSASNDIPHHRYYPLGRFLILGALIAVLFDSKTSKSLAGPLSFPVLGCFAVVFLSFAFALNPARSLAGY
jgi:hypothetical protein